VQALRQHSVAAASYTGDLDADEADERVQKFGAKQLDVLVGTLDAMGEGVDGLQHRCANVVMHDRFWTSAKNDQAVGRVRRSGQLRLVTVHHVFAEATVDATITAACLRKTNVINLLKGRPLVDAIYGRVR
jgi:SNF2 family DNA or RNA helicase